MLRNSLLYSSLLGILVIAGCAPDEILTAPASGEEITAPSFAVAANSWAVKAKIPTARQGLTAGVINNSSGQPVLYAIGGYVSGSVGTVEAYNFATNNWTTKAPLPTRLTRTNGAGVIGGKLYVSGGQFYNTDDVDIPLVVPYLYVYDPSRNTWSRKADMSWASSRGITGVIGGKLYVLVGDCGFADPSECGGDHQLLRYDPATNIWDASLPPCPTAHVGGVGGVIDGKFYVVGGIGTAHRKLQVYDPVRNRWTSKATMPSHQPDAAGAVAGGKLYVIGGMINGVPQRIVQAYDPATNSWKTRAPMPTAHGRLAAARATYKGQRTRANWRAESQAALYHTPGLSPG